MNKSSTLLLSCTGLYCRRILSKVSYKRALVRETLVKQPARMLKPEGTCQELINFPSLNVLGPMWVRMAMPSSHGLKPCSRASGMRIAMEMLSKKAKTSHKIPTASSPSKVETSTRRERRIAARRGFYSIIPKSRMLVVPFRNQGFTQPQGKSI